MNRSKIIRCSGFVGFTLIELIIVLSVIIITVTISLPIYTNYTIRTKIDEALSQAATAKTAAAAICLANPNQRELSNASASYEFELVPYVANIQIQGACPDPVIVLRTRETGANPEATLTLTAKVVPETGTFSWHCKSDNPVNYLPENCR